MSRCSHKTYMKATKGSVSCVIKRIWQLQLEWYSIKAEGEMWCWIWQAARSSLSTMRNCWPRLQFLKGLPQAKGRRRPESEAPYSVMEGAVAASVQSLHPSTWAREEEGVEILAPIMSTTVLRKTACSHLCLSHNASYPILRMGHNFIIPLLLAAGF